jgi:hypothetical protein
VGDNEHQPSLTKDVLKNFRVFMKTLLMFSFKYNIYWFYSLVYCMQVLLCTEYNVMNISGM